MMSLADFSFLVPKDIQAKVWAQIGLPFVVWYVRLWNAPAQMERLPAVDV